MICKVQTSLAKQGYKQSSYWTKDGRPWYPARKKREQKSKIDPNACPFCGGTLMVVDLKTDLPRPCTGLKYHSKRFWCIRAYSGFVW